MEPNASSVYKILQRILGSACKHLKQRCIRHGNHSGGVECKAIDPLLDIHNDFIVPYRNIYFFFFLIPSKYL